MAKPLAVITGANSGVGKEATRVLAREGWAVMMLCRSLERGRAAMGEIQAEVPGATLHLQRLDLGDLDDVRRAVGELEGWLDAEGAGPIEALVNNAGLYRAELEHTPQGFERTMAVNHLGHFLLTLLLEERLRRPGARVVNVSSGGHRQGDLSDRPLDEILRGQGSYRGVQAYCDSKLANVLFSEELFRRWGEDGVGVAALHPGVLSTAIWDRNENLLMKVVRLFKPFMGKAGAGGRAVARVVAEVPAAELTGSYFNRGEPDTAGAAAGDRDLARRLWEESARAVGLEAVG